MILTQVQIVPPGDVAKFAWGALAQFQNVAFVADRLAKLHSLPKSQLKNARKQAEQIRYCLIQAEEYFSAARAVTMSTRPLLLYYGAMSLALADILFKGSGDCSLDRARGQHAHHGLDLRHRSDPSRIHALFDSAAALRAVPLEKKDGQRFGTFELWHRVARENPAVGPHKTFLRGGGTEESTAPLLVGSDVRFPNFPSDGLSLLECFQSHPAMIQVLNQNDVDQHLVRGRVSSVYRENDGDREYQFIIQPTNNIDILNRCYELVEFHPSAVHRLNISEYPSGCILTWNHSEAYKMHFRMPPSIQEFSKDTYMMTRIDSLNEFGILYVGIYILGNYVRYFPDEWMSDVETASPLSLAARTFSEVVEERMALLTLSELSRSYFIRHP